MDRSAGWKHALIGLDHISSFEAPVSTPDNYVTLRVGTDIVIAFNAYPQNILPINGVGHLPTAAHVTAEPLA